jgi:hypothetical protein
MMGFATDVGHQRLHQPSSSAHRRLKIWRKEIASNQAQFVI